MKKLCHPLDEMEKVFILMALESEGIPALVIGDNFGSLYPGVQIASYNERTIRVPESDYNRAVEVLKELRKEFVYSSSNLALSSVARILLEAAVFGWFFPFGSKRKRSTDIVDPVLHDE